MHVPGNGGAEIEGAGSGESVLGLPPGANGAVKKQTIQTDSNARVAVAPNLTRKL